MNQHRPQKVFAAQIIGDEILSGKRTDQHMAKLTQLLADRGLRLSWVKFLGDDRERIRQSLQASMTAGDIVFSFGGIGSTPDDQTRQAAAQALDVELALHPEAEREIRARFGDQTNDTRLLMGTFPVGSTIIPNPFNRIPGFSIRDHHFVPGFPQMAWPMVEWVLDTLYRDDFIDTPVRERAFLLTGANAYEAPLLDLMEQIVSDYPALRLFSLPKLGENGKYEYLELGVEGNPALVDAAMEQIRIEVERREIHWRERD